MRKGFRSRDNSRAIALVLSGALLAYTPLQTAGAEQPDQVNIRSAPYVPPSTVISVDTSLVEVAVTVRDRKGSSVGGLRATDFTVFDNRKQRNITFFSEQDEQPASPSLTAPDGARSPTAPAASPAGRPQPRYIALFFDDAHEGMAGFERSKQAAEKLVGDGLQPGDRLGIFTASGAIALDFTSDAKILLSTLEKLRRHPAPGMIGGFNRCPTLTAYQAYMIAKYLDPMAKAVAVEELVGCGIPYEAAEIMAQDDAEQTWSYLEHQSTNILDALMLIVRHLAGAPGVRILLMVSPGFVTGDMERQTGALTDACLRDHIVINALDDEGLLASGLESPESLGARGGARANWAERTLELRNHIVTTFLAEAAASTGGEFIHNNNDLAGSLRALAAAAKISYLLGFAVPEKPDGKYHTLKVTTAESLGYRVSARPGYFSTPSRERAETAQQRIDRAVVSGSLLDQVPATVTVHAVPGKDNRYRIQVVIALDAKRLPFSVRSGKSLQQITFVTVLEDSAGNYIEGKQAVMDMALTGAKRADLEAKGIKASTSFLVPKGSYRVREVIREAVRDQMAASTSAIEVR